MALPLETAGIHDPDTRRALERISTAWPTPPSVVTTATRPNATRAGRGTMIYDTTISKPVWSDGTVWRDAAGTAA